MSNARAKRKRASFRRRQGAGYVGKVVAERQVIKGGVLGLWWRKAKAFVLSVVNDVKNHNSIRS